MKAVVGPQNHGSVDEPARTSADARQAAIETVLTRIARLLARQAVAELHDGTTSDREDQDRSVGG